MSISGINNQMPVIMTQMRQVMETKMEDALTQVNGDYDNILGSKVDFSKPSELLSQLEQLKNEDPEKFKELMNAIAEKLKEASEEMGDNGFASQMLAELSEKFANAAESGDLSLLQPPPPPPMNPGTNGARINQYSAIQSSGDDEQDTIIDLLEALLKQKDENGATIANGSDILNSIKDLLSDALLKIT